MRGEKILVLAIDGLRAAALGAYGNTAFATPAMDQLAAESFLLDACFADAVELPQLYRALWQSVHPLRHAAAATASAPLPQWLAEHGYEATLITDEPAVAAFPAAAAFDELIELPADPPTRAGDMTDTALARVFAAVLDQVQSVGDRSLDRQLIWLHARGMYGPWDAPLELQERLLEREDGDPPPADVLEPPDLVLDDASDPDAAFRWSCAYAAQIMVLDACVEALHESLDGWLVVLCGVRGFPLGEHQRVGGVDGRLCVEQLHAPMLWRFPDGAGGLTRSRQLASHLDLLPTLVDWLGPRDSVQRLDGVSLFPLVQPAAAALPRELVGVGGNDARAIRNDAWTLRRIAADAPVQLFVRPDDRWEANDVAALCPEVVDDLQQRLTAHAASMAAPAQAG